MIIFCFNMILFLKNKKNKEKKNMQRILPVISAGLTKSRTDQLPYVRIVYKKKCSFFYFTFLNERRVTN